MLFYQGKRIKSSAYVAEDLNCNVKLLLSKSNLRMLQVIPEHFPNRIVNSENAFVTTPDTTETIHPFVHELNILLEEFSSVFDVDSKLKAMNIEPIRLKLKDGADFSKLPHINTARRYPKHIEEICKNELKNLESAGIIKRVHTITPACHMAWFTPKSTPGQVRLLTDFSKGLNLLLDRPVYPTSNTRDVLSDIPANTKVAIFLDSKSGYFQCPIHPDDQPLTTFILPGGRFCYSRCPQGLSISGDEWNKHSTAAFSGIDGLAQLVDDVAICATDTKTLLERLKLLLTRCSEKGITLKRSKIQFLLEPGDKVKWIGHQLTMTKHGMEISPDPDTLKAISDFPKPKNITDVRSFIGLCCQLGQFHPDIQQCVKELTQLLHKDIVFQWLPEHQKSFDLARRILTSAAVVRPFDRNLQSVIVSDSSRLFGYGWMLLQYPKGTNVTRLPDPSLPGKSKKSKDIPRPHLICCGSKTLSKSARNYSALELEANAIHAAVRACHMYLYGSPDEIIVLTDHQALIPLFNKKSIAEMPNARVQRFREKLLDYNLKLTWISNKNIICVDALSRHPVFPAEDTDREGNSKISAVFLAAATVLFETEKTLFQQEADSDVEYQQIIEAFKTRDDKCPRKLHSNHPAKSLQKFWPEISMYNGLLTYNDRILVPKTLRREILDKLHTAHLGPELTYLNAKELYFWPNLRSAIDMMCSRCEECIALRPSLPTETLNTIRATYPTHIVSSDLFYLYGDTYITYRDRFSGFLQCSDPLPSQTQAAVMEQFKAWFKVLGLMKILRTDGGPCYGSTFHAWCQSLGIEHETSTPNEPSSNGNAEIAVKACKHLLMKHRGNLEAFSIGLLEHNNTPRRLIKGVRLSPAQIYFGRRQHTRLPALPAAFQPIDYDLAKAAREKHDDEVKDKFDLHGHDLHQLTPGDLVYLQDPRTNRWSIKGKVLSYLGHRSYKVIANGSTFRRARRRLRPRNVEVEATDGADESALVETTPRRSRRLQENAADK